MKSTCFYALFFVALTLCTLSIPVQSYSQSYFQQKVDFDLKVTLDTLDHRIVGKSRMKYQNNSPETLEFIYFHAWWNCYADNTSAFADQQLELGSRAFYFAKEEERGGYERLEFSDANNALVQEPYVDEDRKHPDIVKVILAKPLESGESVDIEINFSSRVPRLFSRAGRQEDLYRMTQWYPKPAVYDSEGWHPMPYLDMGEFFSEYGDYDVELVVPDNYNCVATGVSQEETISDGLKKLRFTAENVSDFAWFASDSFITREETVKLNTGKDISLTLFTNFDDDHDMILTYMSDAIRFYSTEVGTYPYPQYTLVLSDSEDRGGMEYPMISMVDLADHGQSMDNLIAHEIGHNWFQSALGSNERQYPWMDEGLNSFYERKYNDSKYAEPNFDNFIPKFLRSKNPEYSSLQAGVCHLHCCGKLGKIDRPSDQVDMLNYGSNSYERMAFALRYLEAYLTEPIFSSAMKDFFKEWLHKHPSPKALEQAFRAKTDEDLSWFFTGLIKEGKIYDYKIAGVEEAGDLLNVKVANATSFAIPYHVTAYDEAGVIVHNEWVTQAAKENIIPIPNAEYDRISVNGAVPFEDYNRKNNHYRPGKLLRKAPLSLKYLGQQRDSYTKTLQWTPYVAYNNYDGLMLGLGMYNSFFPYNDLRWYIAPSVGLKSGQLAGSFAVEKDFRRNGAGPIWSVGLQGRKFLFDVVDGFTFNSNELSYTKLVPSLKLIFQSEGMQHRTLDYKVHYSIQDIFCPDLCSHYTTKSTVHQLNYRSSNTRRLSNMNSLVQLEYEAYGSVFGESESYLKLSLEHQRSIYYTKGSQFHLRFFGGYFPFNSQRESANFSDDITRGSFALTQTGRTDHTYEGYYLGRSEQEGDFSKQFEIAEGGFKNPIANTFANTLSNNYLAAVNLKVDLPFSVLGGRFRPFIDLAYLSNKWQLSDELSGQFYYSGGLAFELGEFAGIYMSLLTSEDFLITDFSERISFKIDLTRLNLWRVAENPSALLR